MGKIHQLKLAKEVSIESSEAVKERFLSLIDEHKGVIYKVANTYCRDVEDRKDLVQEIIIQLWNSFGKYDSQCKWSTWMYRIALNVAISFYRKAKRRNESQAPLAENILEFAKENESAERDDNVAALYEFIDRLNKLDKALMILYLENNSHKEISELLGITETNVATKINRIKNKLKQQFSTTQ